jgi:uncharacterized Zn-finger protein
MKTIEIFICNQCNRVFKRKYSLNRHIKSIHLKQKDFQCECGKQFISKDQLARHKISKHSLERPYKCERGCDKAYTTKMARNYHYRSFHENRRFSCTFLGCAREFSSLKNLRNHCNKPHELTMQRLKEKLKKKEEKIQKLKKRLDKLQKQFNEKEALSDVGIGKI